MERQQANLGGYHILEGAVEFDAIRKRFYEALDCDDFYNLAEYLGVKPSRLSDAKRSLRLPSDWLQTVAAKPKVSVTWLLTGEAEPFA